MTVFANKPTLLITVTCPAQLSPEFAKAAQDFRAQLDVKNAAITWLAESPKNLLATGLPHQRDEVGLLGSSSLASRQDVAAAIRSAKDELDQDARQLSSVFEEDGRLLENGDLLAKGGCSAVLSAAVNQRSSRRSSSANGQPKRGRFGLWIVPVTRALRTQREFTHATRSLASDLAGGLVHLSISGSGQDPLKKSLSALATEIRNQANGQCRLKSVNDVTRSLAAGVRSQPAQSILRKAA